jgi:serine/threonine protein phosphatase PrpC
MVDVDTVPLSRGDIILLSSDGFHDFIPENRMIQLLRTIPFPKSGEALLEEVLQQTTDNVTFILYRVF